MSWFRRWGNLVLLPTGLLLTVSSTAGPRAAEPPAARGAGVYEALVDTSAVDSSLEWAGGALARYLDSFVGAAAESGSIGPQPFAAKVRLLTEGEDLVYLVRLENEAGMIADGELRGDPGQVAEWLTDLAVIIERAAFPARESPVAWEVPTSSTGALRRFLEAGRSADFKEKERLLREALAALQTERDALAEERERLEERLAEQKEQIAAVSRELEREKEALAADLESVRGDLEARRGEARDELNAERKRSTGLEREKESLVLLKERLAGKIREMALRLVALEEATSALP